MVRWCGFVATLKEWQSLAGSIIGGIFALSVALIVARQARRGEERSAAYLLITELIAVIGFNGANQKKAASIGSPAERNQFLVNAITRSRPRISPQFDAAVARVRTCDMHLAATLGQISIFLRDVEALVARGEQSAMTVGELLVSTELPEKYDAISHEAEFAVRLLDRYALAHPWRSKLRRAVLGPQKWEADGRAALAKGSFTDYKPD
jgi:hypothetical protein